MKNEWLESAKKAKKSDETEINFLNGKTWIPGHANGQPPSMKFDSKVASDSLKEAIKKVKPEAPKTPKDVEKLKEAMLQSCKSTDDAVPMGFADHPFANGTKAIPRMFRFLVRPKSHPELQYMVKRITVNYYEQTIKMELYEHPDFTTHDYLLYLADSQNKDHELTLTALDGCGRKLYTLCFKGVEPDDHLVEYDYAKSDVLSHQLTLTYEEMNRLSH